MSIYNKSIQDLNALIKKEVRIVKTAKELSIYLANEFCNILEQKQKNNEMLTVILPVGPIDYTYFAKEINKRNLSLKNLRTINMDEYLDEDDKFISIDHPMSFRKFMIDSFFSKIPEER